MGLSENGRDYVAETVGGRGFGRAQAAAAAVSYTATQMADTGAAFSASSGGPPPSPGTGSGLVGKIILAAGIAANTAPVAYGVISDNTTTAVNIDVWHNIATPETVQTTPTSGGAGNGYAILPAGPPAFYMGISIAARVFTATDRFLTNDGSTVSELFFSGGGLRRRLAAYAHTSATNTYTISFTFTANGSDTLPQTVAKVGIFTSWPNTTITTSNTGTILFQTLLSSTATLSAVGDNVQITDTVTIS
jgi:hypothetical protein